MRLSAKVLKNVANINQLSFANEAHIQEGQINEFYFQLVDLDQSQDVNDSQVLPNFPLRYIPQGTVITVDVTFPALRSEITAPATAEEFTVTASQPFTDDKSIYKVSLSSTQLPNSGSLKVKVTVDGVDMFFLMIGAITVNLLEVGGC